MSANATPQRWSLPLQLLHWLTFLLILGAWVAVEAREEFPKGSAERTQWMLLHKSLGLTVFFLVWARLGARLAQVAPAGIGTALQQKAAALVHLGLYGLMLAMPLTGVLASQAEGRAVAWFGLLELPLLVAENEELADLLEDAHEAGFTLLLVLLAAHAGAALYHHVLLKDDALRRMLPWRR